VDPCSKPVCPNAAGGPHAAQSKVLYGPVKVFAVVKVFYILTPCPYGHFYNLDIFDAGDPQYHFITSVFGSVIHLGWTRCSKH